MRLTALPAALLALAACATAPLTPQQERAYKLFAECRAVTGMDVRLDYVDPDGKFQYRMPADQKGIVDRCFRERGMRPR